MERFITINLRGDNLIIEGETRDADDVVLDEINADESDMIKLRDKINEALGETS